ncbi:MAG: penicillin-binding protein, partial [Microvirga sp.]
VITRGSGSGVHLSVPVAGKTGTTNDAKDVWFIGFSPDLAVGVFLGYDKPRSLGASAQAAHYAAPVFRDFMTMALKDKPATPFRVPAGIKLVRVNVSTGTRASGSGEGGGVIVEAFKPGTAPPDTYLPPSDSGGGGESGYAGPQAQGVGPGTGGLY